MHTTPTPPRTTESINLEIVKQLNLVSGIGKLMAIQIRHEKARKNYDGVNDQIDTALEGFEIDAVLEIFINAQGAIYSLQDELIGFNEEQE